MNTFQIRALGWCMEVGGHSLVREEHSLLRKWCRENDHEFDSIRGHLECALGGYSSQSPNAWKTGCLCMLELNRFFLFNPTKNTFLPLTAPLIRKSELKLTRDKKFDMVYPLKVRNNKLLVFFQETKGTGAVWELSLDEDPDLEKFSIRYSKFSLGSESFYYVSGLSYDGVILGRNHQLEDLSGKASYSKLL